MMDHLLFTNRDHSVAAKEDIDVDTCKGPKKLHHVSESACSVEIF